MKIQELINNDEFSFNPRFRIYKYIPSDFESDNEGEYKLEFDSDYADDDIGWEIMTTDISAINQAEDGAMEIEHL